MLDVGNFGRDPEGRDLQNDPPSVSLLSAAEHTVRAGESLQLNAAASDDNFPEPKAAPQGGPGSPRSRSNALGLRVAWYVYRGDGNHVTFDRRSSRSTPTTGSAPTPPGPRAGRRRRCRTTGGGP